MKSHTIPMFDARTPRSLGAGTDLGLSYRRDGGIPDFPDLLTSPFYILVKNNSEFNFYIWFSDYFAFSTPN